MKNYSPWIWQESMSLSHFLICDQCLVKIHLSGEKSYLGSEFQRLFGLVSRPGQDFHDKSSWWKRSVDVMTAYQIRQRKGGSIPVFYSRICQAISILCSWVCSRWLIFMHLLPIATLTGDQIYSTGLCWGREHLRFKFHHNEKENCMNISAINGQEVNRERNITRMGGIKPIYWIDAENSVEGHSRIRPGLC